jgi:signal peptidase I
MAVILALLFRGFVAEAFVIPTGSMAPTLQGRHKHVECPKCHKWYEVSGSPEQDNDRLTGYHVVFTTCPICQYTKRLDPLNRPNEGSFSGDRIIVGKFCYDLAEPKRWDVIVFKFPGGAVQNYIKRLVGLPGELVRVTGGNIKTCGIDEDPEAALRIARKPPHKLNTMLQLVDDTDHIAQDLSAVGWPSRWQAWPAAGSAWQAQDGGRAFVSQADVAGESWLRYRHLVPTHDDWTTIELDKKLPAGVAQRQGQLITDFYAYNTAPRDQAIFSPQTVPIWRSLVTKAYQPPLEVPAGVGPGDAPPPESLGLHWVDDLAVECLAEVTGNSGELSLMLVRSGAKYICRINLADGKATLSIVDRDGQELAFGSDDGQTIAAHPTAQTSVKGPGSYRLRLSNCDHELLLWVNGWAVPFDGPTTYPSEDIVEPYHSASDPGDLAPAGIGVQGAAVKLSGLRIFRDKYYIATRGGRYIETDYRQPLEPARIQQAFRDPSLWAASGLFEPTNRRYEDFPLQADQFLPMGDNSPQSYDGRFWTAGMPGFPEDHHYVERDLLIGKALLIYWPHTWNRPVPFTPNFTQMGPIR